MSGSTSWQEKSRNVGARQPRMLSNVSRNLQSWTPSARDAHLVHSNVTLSSDFNACQSGIARSPRRGRAEQSLSSFSSIF